MALWRISSRRVCTGTAHGVPVTSSSALPCQRPNALPKARPLSLGRRPLSRRYRAPLALEDGQVELVVIRASASTYPPDRPITRCAPSRRRNCDI